MNCSQVKRKLSAFMDGEMDGAISRIIEQHLDGCRDCQEYLLQFKEVDGLIYGLPRIEVNPGFTSRVVSAAIRTSAASNREPVSFASRLESAVARLSEAVFSLFEHDAGPSTRTLDEFSDCPPLSMSFAYFKLVDQGSRGY
jgi:anti-sigma factor RsiW